MDRIDERLQHKPEFQTVKLHYQKTSQMPHHQAYKDLSKKEQFKLDKERLGLEEQHREQILKEVAILVTQH